MGLFAMRWRDEATPIQYSSFNFQPRDVQNNNTGPGRVPSTSQEEDYVAELTTACQS